MNYSLDNNEVLVNIREKYGWIEDRLYRESIRILNEEYNIKVGDIVIDRFDNMSVINGVEVFGLHDYLFRPYKKGVGFRIHSHRFNKNGTFKKNYYASSIWSENIESIKVVGNISEYKTPKDRVKLYKSLIK